LTSQDRSLMRVGDSSSTRPRRVRRNQAVTRLQPQCAALLSHLAGHAGAWSTREALQAALWSRDTFVEFEDGLNHARCPAARGVWRLRPRQPRYIETIRGAATG